MTVYFLKQLLASLMVLFVVVTFTFMMIQLAPGGLSILSDPNLDPSVVANIETKLGLDQPVIVQYQRWITNLLTGDLGSSLVQGRPVLGMILERLPATLLLGGAALLLTAVVGLSVGIQAARHPNSLLDQVASTLSFVGLATPSFWFGILLIILFSVKLGWLPSSGTHTIGEPFSLGDRLAHLLLPALVLSTSTTAELVRYTRSSWLENMKLDYVRVAKSKGLSERAIHLRHILKNALIPVLTVFGLFLPRLVGGTAITETLFSWPGMGSMAVGAAVARDTPLILGITVFVAVAVILSNLLIDLIYTWLDPRIRY